MVLIHSLQSHRSTFGLQLLAVVTWDTVTSVASSCLLAVNQPGKKKKIKKIRCLWLLTQPTFKPSEDKQCRGKLAGLTFQVSDEGDRLDGVARVGKGLDDMVLHYTDHTKAWLVTWNTDGNNKENVSESLKCPSQHNSDLSLVWLLHTVSQEPQIKHRNKNT